MFISSCDRNRELSKNSRGRGGHLPPYAQRRRENWTVEKVEKTTGDMTQEGTGEDGQQKEGEKGGGREPATF